MVSIIFKALQQFTTIRRGIGFICIGLLSAGILNVASAAVTVIAQPNNPPSDNSNPNAATPLAMLNISKDHQLFFKAYDDYTDLNGDGTPDTTYNNAITYYGYFDSHLCYSYNTTNARFEPAVATSNFYCSSQWSGNFLNWATMTRIDEIRKILYGGYRSTDTASTTTSNGTGSGSITQGVTVLERSYLPTDAHSFAKFYNGTDINKLTPFNPATTTANIDGTNTSVSTGLTFCNTTIAICNTTTTICNTTTASADLSQNVTNPPVFRMALGNYSMWGNMEGVQCQWTAEQTGHGVSNTNGNDSTISGLLANTSVPDPTSVSSLGTNVLNQYNVRVQVCVAGYSDTQNCKTYTNTSNSAVTTSKPIGLLQTYGDNNLMNFGLMTGSYAKNKSGGVLRKNIASMNNEINAGDGTFVSPAPSTGSIINTLNQFRIYGYSHTNIQYFKNGSWVYNAASTIGTNSQDGTANCVWGIQSFTDGNCENWGNPQAELFLESLRYLSNKAASSAYLPTTPADSFYLANLGVATTVVTTNNPTIIPSNQWCAKQSLINFNASTSSFDGDQLSGFTDINTGSNTLSQLTDIIGEDEGITNLGTGLNAGQSLSNGKSYIIGSNGGTGTNNNQMCTPKTISGLSSVNGTCPDEPRLQGTYQLDGLAWYANTNDLVPDTVLSGKQTVATYGVALAPKLPLVQVPVPGTTSQSVTIIPACRNSSVGGNCSQAAFQIVSQSCKNSLVAAQITALGLSSSASMNCGLLYANYDDSEFGGDFDLDLWGNLIYIVTSTKVYVTTRTVYQSTIYAMGFGYILMGTANDGFHAHSGVNGFAFADPNPGTSMIGSPGTLSGGTYMPYCMQCGPRTPSSGTPYLHGPAQISQAFDTATSVSYSIGAGAAMLPQPLWYASKWGGFNTALANTSIGNVLTPVSNTASWDSEPDGIPDNYFYATNPASLTTALAKVFNNSLGNISAASSVTPTASSVGSGSTSTNVFVAEFTPTDWSGDLLNITLQANGTIKHVDNLPYLTPADANWDAAYKKIPAFASRHIFTINGSTGVPFQWNASGATASPPTAISTAQMTALETSLAGVVGSASVGQARLNWLSGDQSQEQQNGGIYRNRLRTLLGDIIHSTPVYTAAESNGFGSLTEGANGVYANYLTATKAKRTPMVYVGANDGMLHGFQADVNNSNGNSGVEQFAYIPNAVFSNLSKLTDPSYQHKFFVDATPTVSDAYLSNTWKTALLGGLGAGGKAIYALDISSPTNTTTGTSNFAANNVLWEFTDSSLGYSYSQPQVARLNDGSWVAVFGNGYVSGANAGLLYLVNLSNGSLLKSIATKPSATGADYGLSTVVFLDADKNGTTDYIYAGDLQGSLWKFDLSGATTSSWGLANNSLPLFTATYPVSTSNAVAQSITVPPVLASNPNGGVNIFFGTGSYISKNDTGSNSVTIGTSTYPVYQTFYSIWDPMITSSTGLTVTRSQLVQQTLGKSLAVGTDTYRTSSNNTVTYNSSSSASTNYGWYLDLNMTAGERVISAAVVLTDAILFSSIIPSDDACSDSGTGWINELALFSGAALSNSPFDTNKDGKINSSDNLTIGVPTGVQSTVGMPSGATPIALTDSKGNSTGTCVKAILGSHANDQEPLNNHCQASTSNTTPTPGPTSKRVFWQQLQ